MFKIRGVKTVDVVVTVIILIVLYGFGIYNAIASNFTADLSSIKAEDYSSGKYVEADIAMNLGSYCQEESYRFRFIKTGTADYYVVTTNAEGTNCISLKTNKNTQEWEAMYDETEKYLTDKKKAPAVRHIKGQLHKCDAEELKYLNEYMEGAKEAGVTYSEYYVQEIDGIDAYGILIAAFGVTLVMGLRFFLQSRKYTEQGTTYDVPPEEE